MRADIIELARRGSLATGIVLAMLAPAALGPALPWKVITAGPAEPALAPVMGASPRYARFGRAEPSPEARHLADWVADSGDNEGSDSVIVDKKFATLYVFGADANLRGMSPALLGAAFAGVPMFGNARTIRSIKPTSQGSSRTIPKALSTCFSNTGSELPAFILRMKYFSNAILA
jgi:hypothetical protein